MVGVEGVVHTSRLTIRRLGPADEGNLVRLDSDPEVMRFLTGGRATPRSTIRDDLLPRLLAEYDTGAGLGRFAAEDRGSGEFVGWVALSPSGRSGEAELGYRLRRQVWGQGLATEAARALIELGFTRLGLHRVWAQTMAVNTASRRVMHKAGLRYRRTFHLEWDDPIPGAEQGEVEYELLRSQWSAAPRP